jgi:hypothetical protein
MTNRIITRLRVIDAILRRASLYKGQPRSIDRYIDYFGDGQARMQDGAPAK